MQLTTAVIQEERDDEITAPGDTNANPDFAEYEARRCAVCGCRYPPFGFGPLASKGTTLWACAAHQQEVDRQLRADGDEHRADDHSQQIKNRQATLF
jgi:hypothetical protein